MIKHKLIFDEIILKQLKNLGKDRALQKIISKILDKLEEKGPEEGDIIDSRLHIYEVKRKNPPIRLYFKYNLATDEIYIFEYEMKTSPKKQRETISKLRKRLES